MKCWVIIVFQNNPQARWWNYPLLAQAEESCHTTNRGCARTTVMNSRLLILITVKSATSQMMLQWP